MGTGTRRQKSNMQRAILLSLAMVAMVAMVSAGTTTYTYYDDSKCANPMNTSSVVCEGMATSCKAAKAPSPPCKQTSGKCQFVYTTANPSSAVLSACKAELTKKDYGTCQNQAKSGAAIYGKKNLCLWLGWCCPC